jgi:hypothetical protein
VKVLGIDFTSRPSARKPLTCTVCDFEPNGLLRFEELLSWETYSEFENALRSTGPWIAGIDFPFGQSRTFITNAGWPNDWGSYVAHAAAFGRDGFRQALEHYKSNRSPGDREHRRATDVLASSVSPQKLYGVPVALMFFEGARRLLASGVTIPHLLTGDPERIAVEAYPGVLARTLIGRRSYKHDSRRRQTADQLDARRAILAELTGDGFRSGWGFGVIAPPGLATDPTGDRLDSLLCAVQAAWAWTRRTEGFGAPPALDLLEGWISDPNLRSR